MDPPANHDPRSAGALLALCVIGGVAVGLVWREPTIGLLGGFALGVALAVAAWLADRRRG